ncbi:MAG: T9SS type A sorting domain-containing protein, partial [Bacteroidota bacterium]
TGQLHAQDMIVKSVAFNYDFQTALISGLDVEIENLGNFSVLDDFTIEVRVNGIGAVSCVGTQYTTDWFNNGSLGANDSKIYNLSNIDLDQIDNSCGLPTGNYHLEIEVDVSNDVSEDNENNNIQAFVNDDFYFESLNTVAVDDPQRLTFQIFPNPAQTQVSIRFDQMSDPADLKLISTTGAVVMETQVEAQATATTLDLSQVPAGLYFATLNTSEGRVVRKLHVAH